jgi:aspartate aminotransferase
LTPAFSQFARTLSVETAFNVLAIARQLRANGKDIIELEVGDSPFPSTPAARQAGILAIEENQTHYCPSAGLPEFRAAAAEFVNSEFGIPAKAENIVVAPGAKIFEQYFCEAFLDPGDQVLVFSPYFPTFLPNILRRGAVPVISPLTQAHQFRPNLNEIARFLETPRAKGIFLNSPHNPTGGLATAEDLEALADLIRGREVAVFSDEPYCHMVWQGRHRSLLELPGMIDQCVAAYTFSKSYSMSGWRLGFAVAAASTAEMIGKMINTSLSCTPPFVQQAGLAALQQDLAARREQMEQFRNQIELLVKGLNSIPGFYALRPMATFYAFPNVAPVCNRLSITSHGLAMYLLEGADDAVGVACLGGECFGEAGAGFLRFSCAEPAERLKVAVEFISQAIGRPDRVDRYLRSHPQHRLSRPYSEPSPHV